MIWTCTCMPVNLLVELFPFFSLFLCRVLRLLAHRHLPFFEARRDAEVVVSKGWVGEREGDTS